MTATIEVGDTIKITNPLTGGVRAYRVHRVTATRAYIRWNEHAEGCFLRAVDLWGVRRFPRSDAWDRTKYELVKGEGS